jgi:DNA-binding NarL/FixJ family response regulator
MELTKSEILISAYITAGYSYRKIAKVRNISLYTVETHVEHIRKKKNVKKVTEIARVFALEYGCPFEFLKNYNLKQTT